MTIKNRESLKIANASLQSKGFTFRAIHGYIVSVKKQYFETVTDLWIRDPNLDEISSKGLA